MDDEKSQKKQFEIILEQKERLLKRTKHEVRDDVKNGVLSKGALVVEPLHKLGVPTDVIQRGAILASDARAFLTKSDESLCEYYANYDKIQESKRSEVSNIVKAVDRQEEATMDARADLSSTKLRYSAYNRRLKQAERLAKAEALSNKVVSSEECEDGLSGELADYLSFGE